MRLRTGSALGIVFVVLKLLGVISWNWALVLAPFWISALIWLVIIIISIIIAWRD